MSDVRPTRGDGGGEAARLLVESTRHRDAALRQLGIDQSHRLSEWQLATIRRLLAGLIGVVEDDLRSGLAGRFEGRPSLHAALSSSAVALAAPVVQRAPLAAEGDLLSHLMRRLEEHRLQRAAAQRASLGPLAALIGDSDEEISSDAMAALIAQSRRLDRFQEPLMARTELPAELQHRLVWTVAAALRLYLVACHAVPPAEADEALAAEAEALLGQYDEGDTLEARSMRLARRLDRAARLEDALLEAAASGGNLGLFIAGVAVRAGLSYGSAWDVLADPDGRGPALLLRAAGIARPAAAAILLALAAGSESTLASQVDLFDATPDAEARDALLPWRIDPAYRASLAALLAAEAA